MSSRAQSYALIGAVLFALGPVVALVMSAARLIPLPYDLEHIEGEVIMSLCEIKQGLSAYPDASAPRMVPIYAPLFYWLAAPFVNCTGENIFGGARGFALAAYLLSVVALTFCVWRARREDARAIGITFCLLLALTLTQFRRLGYWYFLARVDSLAFFFAALAWAILRQARGRDGGLIWTGVALAAAIATKQSYVLMLPFVGAVVFLGGRGDAALTRARRVALIGFAPTIYLISLVAGGGWPAWTTLFVLPGQHGLIPEKFLTFWTHDLKKLVGLEALIALGFLFTLVRRGKTRQFLYSIAFVSALVLVSYSSRLHNGGYVNVNIPAAFAITTLGVAGFVRLAWARPRAWLSLALGVTLIAVVAGRRWGYGEITPSPESIGVTESLIELARTHDVFFTDVPQINAQAGRTYRGRPLHVVVNDDLRADHDRLPDYVEAPAAIRAAEDDLARGRYDYIVTNGLDQDPAKKREGSLLLVNRAILCAKYRALGEIKYESARTMLPPIGFETRPRLVFARAADADRLAREFAAKLPLVFDSSNFRGLPPTCLPRTLPAR